MRICFKYFSGTGNTKYIADKAMDALKNDHEVTNTSIENDALPEHDLLIIGGPIYAGNCPKKLIRYIIRNIPIVNNKKAIIYTTSTGFLNAFGTDSLSQKLKSKGYTIIKKCLFRMPRNYYFGHYRETELDIGKEMLIETHKEINNLIEFINSNKHPEIELNTKGILGRDLLEEFFSIMARFMGKSYKANEDCIKCMQCINNCPTKNIKLENNKIKFGFNCMLCTRCIHNCPVHAIEYNKKLYPQYKLKKYLEYLSKNN